jgi:5-formyltetrahydrofolate cyclo-ligase
MSTAERKAFLREAGRKRWLSAGSADDLAAKGLAIQERFLSAFPPIAGSTIALYAPVRCEVGTELIRAACLAAGARLYYPRALKDRSLLFLPHGEKDRWVEGRFGIMEPEAPPGTEGRTEGFDLVVVPGLVFDRKGGRLGQGYGYYDRFLSGPGAGSIKAGLAFSWQVVPEVPVDAWDVPLNVLVTEEETLWISGTPLSAGASAT